MRSVSPRALRPLMLSSPYERCVAVECGYDLHGPDVPHLTPRDVNTLIAALLQLRAASPHKSGGPGKRFGLGDEPVQIESVRQPRARSGESGILVDSAPAEAMARAASRAGPGSCDQLDTESPSHPKRDRTMEISASNDSYTRPAPLYKFFVLMMPGVRCCILVGYAHI